MIEWFKREFWLLLGCLAVFSAGLMFGLWALLYPTGYAFMSQMVATNTEYEFFRAFPSWTYYLLFIWRMPLDLAVAWACFKQYLKNFKRVKK